MTPKKKALINKLWKVALSCTTFQHKQSCMDYLGRAKGKYFSLWTRIDEIQNHLIESYNK